MGTGSSKVKGPGKRKSIASFAEKDVAELAAANNSTSAITTSDAANSASPTKGSPRRFSAPASILPPLVTQTKPSETGGDQAPTTTSSVVKPHSLAMPVPTPTRSFESKKFPKSPPPVKSGNNTDFDDYTTSDGADNDNDNDNDDGDKTTDNEGDEVDGVSADGSLPSPISDASPSRGILGSTAQLHGVSSDKIGPKSKHNVDDLIARLLEVRNQKVSKSLCLKTSEVASICHAARQILLSQPILLELLPPVNIVGDIHGQYEDLLRIFDMCGRPPDTNYLFLGDYVDRGKQSLETILLLLCYKIKYPENFFILRGNHECASVNRVYGFYDECKRRCSLKIWRLFTDVFNCLPIAALVAGKIFCIHGGLSPHLHTMDDIRDVTRPSDVPDYGLLNDLLWSDPSDTATDWEDNERGVSYCFSKQIVSEFLARHDLDLVCRAHMVVEEGYEFFNNRTLVTVFSAPNYCGEFDNKGAVMCVNEDLLCSFEILAPQLNPRFKGAGRRRMSPPLVK